jgi:queuine tRNA-ribosyltransferase
VNCDCHVCRTYTRSYLRHLYSVGEYLAGQLISYHNLYFYLNMAKEARKAIIAGHFSDYYDKFTASYLSEDF